MMGLKYVLIIVSMTINQPSYNREYAREADCIRDGIKAMAIRNKLDYRVACYPLPWNLSIPNE